MSYDLHITRREYWDDEEGPEITLDEWRAYAAGDADIVLEQAGGSGVFKSGQDRLALSWRAIGEIAATDAPPALIGKMVKIAAALGALVRGDDGEIYGIDPADPTKSVPR